MALPAMPQPPRPNRAVHERRRLARAAFDGTSALTVGVEEEAMLLDPPTLDPLPDASASCSPPPAIGRGS
jgi:hypothetical protein